MADENRIDPRTVEGSRARALDRGEPFAFPAIDDDKGSMGDPDFVEGQVRQMLVEAVEVRKRYWEDNEAGASERAQKAIADLIERWTAELSADNEAHTQSWGATAQDLFLRQRGFGDATKSGDPHEGLKALVAHTVQRVIDTAVEAEDGTLTDDDAQFRVDAAVEDMKMLMLGMDNPADQEG